MPRSSKSALPESPKSKKGKKSPSALVLRSHGYSDEQISELLSGSSPSAAPSPDPTTKPAMTHDDVALPAGDCADGGEANFSSVVTLVHHFDRDRALNTLFEQHRHKEHGDASTQGLTANQFRDVLSHCIDVSDIFGGPEECSPTLPSWQDRHVEEVLFYLRARVGPYLDQFRSCSSVGVGEVELMKFNDYLRRCHQLSISRMRQFNFEVDTLSSAADRQLNLCWDRWALQHSMVISMEWWLVHYRSRLARNDILSEIMQFCDCFDMLSLLRLFGSLGVEALGLVSARHPKHRAVAALCQNSAIAEVVDVVDTNGMHPWQCTRQVDYPRLRVAKYATNIAAITRQPSWDSFLRKCRGTFSSPTIGDKQVVVALCSTTEVDALRCCHHLANVLKRMYQQVVDDPTVGGFMWDRLVAGGSTNLRVVPYWNEYRRYFGGAEAVIPVDGGSGDAWHIADDIDGVSSGSPEVIRVPASTDGRQDGCIALAHRVLRVITDRFSDANPTATGRQTKRGKRGIDGFNQRGKRANGAISSQKK